MGRGDLAKTQDKKHRESIRRRQTKLERAREISMASLSRAPIAVPSFDLEERFRLITSCAKKANRSIPVFSFGLIWAYIFIFPTGALCVSDSSLLRIHLWTNLNG